MVKFLSLYEFNNRCYSKWITGFALTARDQDLYARRECISSTVLYKKVTVSFSPDTVVFGNDFGYLMLSNVKYILYDNEAGDIFTFVCGSKILNSKEERYILTGICDSEIETHCKKD